MRRFLVSLILLLTTGICARAQYRNPTFLNNPDYDSGHLWHFGFSIGVNFMDFDVENSLEPELTTECEPFQYVASAHRIVPGFNVNAICDLRISENLHARFLPGYALGQRNLDFYVVDSSGIPVYETVMKLESSYIELPLGFKYVSQRYCNVRPYLYAGGNARFDIAAFKRMKIEEGVLLRLAKFDVYYEVGVGIDFFLSHFKFSTELIWSVGLLNVASDDYADGAENYRNALDRLRSRMVVLKFHFE